MTSIRNMRPTDRIAVTEMIMNVIGGTNARRIAETEVKKYLSSKDYRVLVAQERKAPVGFGVIKYDPFEGSAAVAELGLFQINEDCRGRGIGTALLNAFVKELNAKGIRKIYTKTNVMNLKAVCYWIKRGFQFEARLNKMNVNTDYYLLGREISPAQKGSASH